MHAVFAIRMVVNCSCAQGDRSMVANACGIFFVRKSVRLITCAVVGFVKVVQVCLIRVMWCCGGPCHFLKHLWRLGLLRFARAFLITCAVMWFVEVIEALHLAHLSVWRRAV